MKICSSLSPSLSLLRGLLAIGCLVAAQAASAQVTLNFVNADIDQVARAIGAATGKTIIVDPRVKGTINLVSEQPVDADLAFKTLQSTLRLQGYAIVSDHGVYKVVPEADAKLQGVPSIVSNTASLRGDQVITQVFRLKNESANNLLPVLRPLIAPNNAITAYPANNTLVVTDYADNMQRIAQIIAAIDVSSSGNVDVVPLRNGNATDVAALLQKMLDPSGIGGSDATLRVLVTADPRTNSVMLRASNESRMIAAKALVAKLDQSNPAAGNMHVVHLVNADAVKLAATLHGMLGGGGSGGGAGGSPGSASGQGAAGGLSTGTSGQPPLPSSGSSSAGLAGSGSSSGGGGAAGASFSSDSDSGGGAGGMVQADASTNSLIITASEPVYRNLRNVIDQLDARRAQVYIESLILEVSSEKTAALGIQWQGILYNNSNGIYAGTNYGSGGSNIVDLTASQGGLSSTNPGAFASIPQGLNIGLVHRFNGLLGIGGLLQALDTTSGINILSTPNLVTLENEEAKIVIGQNVPFITGAYSQTGSTATVTPFQTFDRQDVGITLRVKPQITEGGTVRLQIYQESSSVVAGTAANAGGVTTNKRSIQSTVLCDDGQIIVLGGLIQDSYTDGNNKVPYLGDLPVVGGLFRTENKDRSKTNLMVFLRPVIIRDAATSAEISQNRYDLVRQLGRDYQSDNKMIKDSDTPQLPPASTVNPGSRPVDHLFDIQQLTRPVPVTSNGAVPAAQP